MPKNLQKGSEAVVEKKYFKKILFFITKKFDKNYFCEKSLDRKIKNLYGQGSKNLGPFDKISHVAL